MRGFDAACLLLVFVIVGSLFVCISYFVVPSCFLSLISFIFSFDRMTEYSYNLMTLLNDYL